jgi:pimeloyl-ACP methyl ester carboxylesterase
MTTTTTTTSNHRRRRRFGLAILGAAFISATACGRDGARNAADITGPSPTMTTTAATSATSATSTTTASTTAPVTPNTNAAIEVRPTATIDELVAVQGARLHVRCTGSGDTTVLLIAGFEAGSDGWAKVEPTISARTRVCSYDRPGTGTSDPADATETFSTQAADLHEVLAKIGEPGPYVVVGHSFGGAEAVTFASEFTDEVTGLVLVDASPVTWPGALCDVADDGSDAATMLRGLCAGWSDPNGNVEHLDVLAAFAGAATITSLGTLPIVVVTAVDRQFAPGLAAEETARLTDVWDSGQQQWSQLSTASRVVSVEDTSHYIQLDHPDVVIDEITRLLP